MYLLKHNVKFLRFKVLTDKKIGIMNIEIIKNVRNLVFTSGWMIGPKGEVTNNTPLAD